MILQQKNLLSDLLKGVLLMATSPVLAGPTYHLENRTKIRVFSGQVANPVAGGPTLYDASDDSGTHYSVQLLEDHAKPVARAKVALSLLKSALGVYDTQKASFSYVRVKRDDGLPSPRAYDPKKMILKPGLIVRTENRASAQNFSDPFAAWEERTAERVTEGLFRGLKKDSISDFPARGEELSEKAYNQKKAGSMARLKNLMDRLEALKGEDLQKIVEVALGKRGELPLDLLAQLDFNREQLRESFTEKFPDQAFRKSSTPDRNSLVHLPAESNTEKFHPSQASQRLWNHFFFEEALPPDLSLEDLYKDAIHAIPAEDYFLATESPRRPGYESLGEGRIVGDGRQNLLIMSRPDPGSYEEEMANMLRDRNVFVHFTDGDLAQSEIMKIEAMLKNDRFKSVNNLHFYYNKRKENSSVFLELREKLKDRAHVRYYRNTATGEFHLWERISPFEKMMLSMGLEDSVETRRYDIQRYGSLADNTRSRVSPTVSDPSKNHTDEVFQNFLERAQKEKLPDGRTLYVIDQPTGGVQAVEKRIYEEALKHHKMAPVMLFRVYNRDLERQESKLYADRNILERLKRDTQLKLGKTDQHGSFRMQRLGPIGVWGLHGQNFMDISPLTNRVLERLRSAESFSPSPARAVAGLNGDNGRMNGRSCEKALQEAAGPKVTSGVTGL